MSYKVNCVDISEFQPDIDFKKLKSNGIACVILRAGYGKEVSQKDSCFEKHYAKAKEAGLKIGCYWCSYAKNREEARQEADTCLTCVKGKTFDLPVFYDMEDYTLTSINKSTLTNIAIAFCDSVKSVGYTVGVYANLNWFTNYLDYEKLRDLYYIWLAQYNSENQLECDIWQNSSTARLAGYSGNLDTDIIFNGELYTNVEKTKPTLTYRVYYNHKWSNEVKGLSSIAGAPKQAISAVTIKVSDGDLKYRVHLLNGSWLPWVCGYNINDNVNGYAGIKEKVIDLIQIDYKGNSYKATYKVRPQGSSRFYPWQFNIEQQAGRQEGYAGSKGVKIDGLQVTLT